MQFLVTAWYILMVQKNLYRVIFLLCLQDYGIFKIYQKGNNIEHPNFIKKEQQAIYLEDMQYLLPINY